MPSPRFGHLAQGIDRLRHAGALSRARFGQERNCEHQRDAGLCGSWTEAILGKTVSEGQSFTSLYELISILWPLLSGIDDEEAMLIKRTARVRRNLLLGRAQARQKLPQEHGLPQVRDLTA